MSNNKAHDLAEWIVGELDAAERAERDPSARLEDVLEEEEWRELFFKRARELAEIVLGVTDCSHTRRIKHPGDETFSSREGCLDCDRWLEPVKLKRP